MPGAPAHPAGYGSGQFPARPASAGPTPLVLLALATGGLVLVARAAALTYALVDDYSSSKPMLVLLLALGLACAGTAVGLARGRALPRLQVDGPLTSAVAAFVLGMVAIFYGAAELLVVLGS